MAHQAAAPGSLALGSSPHQPNAHHPLAVAMVRAHLRFRPAWEQEQLAERNDVLVLYDSFCTAQKQLLLVLLGLNRLYYPGWRWLVD